MINGFEDFSTVFRNIVHSENWKAAESSFAKSNRILTAGNGGNLAVCDHGAIDIARLTDKHASAPGSGILASSLINDTSHDEWVLNWAKISLRGMSKDSISNTMIIGVSSSGNSKNICKALQYCHDQGSHALLISAVTPKVSGDYNTVILNVDEYHTSEVLTLSLFYQLIHSAGFTCPTISKSNDEHIISDYSQ
jgi:D-sedoheptulose 7-phosphate isomerase